MATIYSIQVDAAGQVGVVPRRVTVHTSGTYSDITTRGFLSNSSVTGITLLPTDEIHVTYAGNNNVILQPIFNSDGTITLKDTISSVLLPVVDGDFTVFNGTTGQIKDAGYSASNPAKTKVVMLDAASTASRFAMFTDTAGTVGTANTQLALRNSGLAPIIVSNITLTAAALAAGGHAPVYTSTGSQRFQVLDIKVRYSASGLSGGGGDRLVNITDGTTIYNSAGITAALLGAPVNTVWGGTGNPLPGTIDMATATAAGVSLYAVYTGGTADYTTGSFLITITLEQIA